MISQEVDRQMIFAIALNCRSLDGLCGSCGVALCANRSIISQDVDRLMVCAIA
ncbi:hypothetical protein ACKFKG_05360 [Phormidesmis sp. 146-35]